MDKRNLRNLFVVSLDTENPSQLFAYEHFVRTHKYGSFFQSLRWKDLKSNWANEILIVRDAGGTIFGTVLILVKRLPLVGKSILYAPRGPVCDYQDTEVLQLLLQAVLSLKGKYHACLLRMDPCIADSDTLSIRQFLAQGFRFTPDMEDYRTVQIRHNYVLALEGKTEEEIFAAFHPKWRYNIRLAQRKGVLCRVCSRESLPEFYALLKTTGKRDGFTVRSLGYYEKMMDALGNYCRLYMCYYGDEALSGALAVQFAGKTCYVYGGSSNQNRNLMPNYLMQWRMIQWAIATHCRLYDFMGIPYFHDENHRNYGVYRFKKGFCGRVLSYAGEFDYLLSPLSGRLCRWYLERKRTQPVPVSPEESPAYANAYKFGVSPESPAHQAEKAPHGFPQSAFLVDK